MRPAVGPVEEGDEDREGHETDAVRCQLILARERRTWWRWRSSGLGLDERVEQG